MNLKSHTQYHKPSILSSKFTHTVLRLISGWIREIFIHAPYINAQFTCTDFVKKQKRSQRRVNSRPWTRNENVVTSGQLR
jgi:hypothetical protein